MLLRLPNLKVKVRPVQKTEIFFAWMEFVSLSDEQLESVPREFQQHVRWVIGTCNNANSRISEVLGDKGKAVESLDRAILLAEQGLVGRQREIQEKALLANGDSYAAILAMVETPKRALKQLLQMRSFD